MPTNRIAASVLAVSLLTTAASTQSARGQWLIEKVGGVWEVREKGRAVRRVSEKYDVLSAGSQVRCIKNPCTLEYSTDGGAPKPLFPKTPAVSVWVTVPQPTQTPLARTSTELQQMIGAIGVRGGADKNGPMCGGDLPLLAPACNDTVDRADFTVAWTPRPSEAGRQFTLLIGGADSSEKRRWNAIPADSGLFRLKAVEDYLANLQLPDRPTDVTVRLMRTESLDAIRLVRLPSRADDAVFQNRIQALSGLPELPRQLGTMEESLKLGMWSKTAHIARQLLRDAPNSLEIQKYALVGYCGSDFADEIARLRQILREAGVTGLCAPEAPQP